MPAVLLDTNVLFASASAGDQYHETAREIVRGVDIGELPDSVVTNYVVAETLNLTRERLGATPANGLLDRLVTGAHFDVSHSTTSDFNAAQALFRQYDGLSFVDSTIVAHMDREGIEYLYSFDDDFDAVEEITRIETPNDPFASE